MFQCENSVTRLVYGQYPQRLDGFSSDEENITRDKHTGVLLLGRRRAHVRAFRLLFEGLAHWLPANVPLVRSKVEGGLVERERVVHRETDADARPRVTGLPRNEGERARNYKQKQNILLVVDVFHLNCSPAWGSLTIDVNRAFRFP